VKTIWYVIPGVKFKHPKYPKEIWKGDEDMWSRRCCFFRLSCFSSCRACGCCDSCTMHDEEHIITEENKKKVEESYFYRFCQGWNILVTTRGNPLVALLLLMQSVLVPIAMLIVMILAVVLSCVAIVVTFVPVILVSIAVFIYKIWDNSIVKEEARKKKLKQAAAQAVYRPIEKLYDYLEKDYSKVFLGS
jgi:hypothetical protein